MNVYRKTFKQSSVKIFSEDIKINGKYLSSFIQVLNVTHGKKSSLNWDSNSGLLAYCNSALTTELLRPDILTDSDTPVTPVTYSPSW